MRLRLYHHRDGARIAYRETGAGPPIALLHSLWLSHREWEPIIEPLSARFRVILPDLPFHGDSEDRPRHPYTPEWLAEVIAGFCEEVLGPRPVLAAHDLGAELILRGLAAEQLNPARLVLMPTRLHRREPFSARRAAWRGACRAAVVPGVDRLLSHLAPLAFSPALGEQLSHQGNRAARDLVRHAFGDVPGNGNRARAWAKFTRRWPTGAWGDLLELYPRIRCPVLLLWADHDSAHPVDSAQEALDLLPDAQLRTIPGTGFLIAYDDPVSVARELIAFCG